MALIERVQADAVTALKAGDRERCNALRLIVSELRKAEKDDGASGTVAEDRDGSVVIDTVAEQGGNQIIRNAQAELEPR